MRVFSSTQKKVLFALSEGTCQICGNPLERGWEADHVIPYSKDGKTNIPNGQAVCLSCNRKKSNKMSETKNKSLREWQQKCFTELQIAKADGRNTFLAVAGVGSGKTFFSAYVFNHFHKKAEFDSVVIISPTENIKRNWSLTFQVDFGIKVDHGYQFKHAWPRDCNGVSLTFQSLNALNLEVLKRYMNKKVLLIIDEVHHAGDERSWGDAILELGEEAGFVLLLSGTPTRRDNSAIPFVKYKEETDSPGRYKLQSDYYYGYAESIKDRVCCPTIFQKNFSDAETFAGYKKLEYATEENPESKRLLNGILTVRKTGDCFVYQTFLKANAQLSEINDKRNSNYAGLIVCKSIEDAQNIYERIYEEFGADFAEIVTSDDKDSSKKIENFKTSYKTWMISINMVSEGVDIPRIRAIVYVTNVTTMVRFMQVMGRGVRNPDHRPNDNDVCYMYIPEYKPIVDNARLIEEEISHIRLALMESLKREYTSGEEQIRLDDVVLSATSENNGNVFAGNMFELKEDMTAVFLANKYHVSKDIVLSLWNEFFQETGKPTVAERPIKIQTITEEKEDYKRMVSRIVGRISYEYKLEFKDIHFKLNQALGRGKSSNVLTLDELKQKYELAKQMYEQLKNKKNG